MYTKVRMTILPLMVVVLLSSSTTSAAVASQSQDEKNIHHIIIPPQKKMKMLFDDWLKRFPKSYASLTTTFSSSDGSDTNLRKKSSGENGGSRNNNNNNNVEDDEYLKRYEIFKTNLYKIHKHNKAYQLGLTSYVMTIYNEFGDMTDDEFTSHYLMESQNCSATTHHQSSGKLRPSPSNNKQQQTNHHPTKDTPSVYKPDLNKSIDWRTKGVITPIKNQKHCGSCWTFSTTGCLEAHTCIQAKAASMMMTSEAKSKASDDDVDSKKFDCTSWTGLAEQQLVDCAQSYNNFGCNGGLPSQAYEYIKYNGGIDFESSYPYKANETGSCLFTPNGIGSKVAEVFNITTKDEDDLEYAIGAIGPVSIAYQVSPDFRHYSHGVYDSFNATTNTTMCNNTSMDVNHAVVAVGLGTTQVDKSKNVTTSQPYYIVRNSWGTSWGMEGYFWMERGTNLCGVSDCASFPLVPRTNNRNDNIIDNDKKTTKEMKAERYNINKKYLLNRAMESASSIL